MRSHRLAVPGLALVLGAVGVMAIGGGALAVSPNAPAAPGVAVAQNVCGNLPLDVVIVLDTSGSMSSNTSGSPAQTRLHWAEAAATQLVNDLDGHGGVGGSGRHHVGLTTFSGTTATLRVALGTSTAATVNTSINGLSASGNTPLKTGMAAGAADLTAHERTTAGGLTVQHVIIFLSDGRPNPDQGPNGAVATSTSGQRPTQAELTGFQAPADKIYSIAIGTGGTSTSAVDLGLMQLLAKPASGHFFNVVDSSLLPTLFSSIYTEIACPSPDVTSSLSGGDKTGAKITVPAGTSVSDQAFLSGAAKGFGGTVTYTVYTDDACSVVFAGAGTKTVVDGIAPVSDAVAFPGAGTFYWRIHYSPDGTHSSADSECTAEVVTVPKPEATPTATATTEPTPTPTNPPTASPAPTATPTATPTPTPTTAPTAKPTPVQSLEGATATPSKAPTATPVQIVEAATSVPTATTPATTTGGTPGGSGGSPLFALLVALMFGGFGLVAVEAQRRSVCR
jgi:Mg-chelatase subunit ChlD